MPGSDAPVTLIVHGQSAPSGELVQVLTAVAGPLTGIVTALLVSWLSDRYSRRRDKEKFENDSSEATRVEHLKRDLAALEAFSESVVGMEDDLSNATTAAFSGDPAVWNKAFTAEPSLSRAIAISAIYFPTALSPEWDEFRRAYRAAVVGNTALAHASMRNTDRRLAEGRSDVELLDQFQAAKRELLIRSEVVMTLRPPLLQKISEVAKTLRRAKPSVN